MTVEQFAAFVGPNGDNSVSSFLAVAPFCYVVL